MTALFMAPAKFVPFVLGFALFRFFDIYKPPPANVWQRYRRGWGVMADDIASGIYAACVLQLILFFLDKWGVSYV